MKTVGHLWFAEKAPRDQQPKTILKFVREVLILFSRRWRRIAFQMRLAIAVDTIVSCFSMHIVLYRFIQYRRCIDTVKYWCSLFSVCMFEILSQGNFLVSTYHSPLTLPTPAYEQQYSMMS
jgi:hypothetical protein